MKNWIKAVHGRQSTVGRKQLAVDCRLSTVDRKPGNRCVAFLWLIVFAFSGGMAVASEAGRTLSVKEILQKVEEAQAKVRDVQMDLDMEMTDSLSGQKQNFKGVVKTKSSGKIYVRYTKPEEQFLYISGNLAQMYQPGQKMVYRQKNPAGKNAPLYLGVSRELKRYAALSRVSIARNSDTEALLLFTPKSEDAGFDKMKVLIRKKDWWPCQVEVETAAGRTQARFSRLVFNQGVEEKWFKFKPPPDAQVVEGVIF